MDEQTNPVVTQNNESSIGPIIGAIVVLAVIIFGALYFMNDRGADENGSQYETLNAQSNSDAAADIEADLNATDVESVDYDLNEENYTAS